MSCSMFALTRGNPDHVAATYHNLRKLHACKKVIIFFYIYGVLKSKKNKVSNEIWILRES